MYDVGTPQALTSSNIISVHDVNIIANYQYLYIEHFIQI